MASGSFRHVTLSVGTGQNQNTLIPANFRIHFDHERPNVVGNALEHEVYRGFPRVSRGSPRHVQFVEASLEFVEAALITSSL